MGGCILLFIIKIYIASAVFNVRQYTAHVIDIG